MKTKITAIFLLAAMIMCLVGCGEGLRDNYTGSDTDSDVSPSSNTESAADKKFVRGTVENNVYSSELLGAKIELSDGWTFYSDAQILELNNIFIDSMDDDDIIEKLEQSKTTYDMYAQETSTTYTINISFESLSLTNRILLNEDSYIDASKDDSIKGLESAGFKDITFKKSRVKFIGEDHGCIEITANVNGVTVYEKLAVVKCGKYMAIVCVATAKTDMTSDILAKFEKL